MGVMNCFDDQLDLNISFTKRARFLQCSIKVRLLSTNYYYAFLALDSIRYVPYIKQPK